MRSFHLLATLVTLATPSVLSAQQTGVVGGRVVDAASGEPVEGVLVTVNGVTPALSDDRGLFEFPRVPVGEHGISFQHLAYGTHHRTVVVRVDEETAIRAAISVEAIALEEIVVESLSELERRRITSGHSINELSPQEIDAAARAGLSFGDLLQGSLPGVDVRADELGLCVTYRAIRTGNDLGDCNGLTVVLDGVPVSDPAYVYSSVPLQDIERVEVLSPAQAGVRYGMRNGQGALLIETKRGPVQRRSDMTRYLTGLDWSQESQPYPWLKVFGSTLLVNAAALGISYLMVDECFWTQESSLALRTRCGPLGTTGAAVLSVALPAAGAGVVARWVGSTDRSRGRLVPAMVAGGLALTAGYIMVLGGEGGAEVAGSAVLSLGVPAVLTLADRIIRIRR